MKRVRMTALLTLLPILFALPAWGAERYRVGCLFSITGSSSWLGEPERNTAVMIAEQINEKGGINGHELELFIEDTQGNNTKAINAVKKLIKKNKVCAIIGPTRSGTSLAVIPVVQKNQIPLVSCAAAQSIVVPVEKRRWIFKTPQKDSDAARRIYDHMTENGIKKVGILTGTTGFGAAGREQLKTVIDEYPLEIVADETYAPADTDMTAQLISVKNAKADAVINWSIVPAQSIVPKNMAQLKLDIPLYQSHGFGNIKYAEAAGEAAEGIIFPGSRLLAVDTLPKDHPQQEVLLKYREQYEARFDEPVSNFGGYAYDALWMVVNALETVGDDPAKIRDHLETIKFVGTAGMFEMSPQDHSGLDKQAFEMLTVKDGKFVVLGD